MSLIVPVRCYIAAMALVVADLLSPRPALAQAGISAVWANDGGDKVLREERRASGGLVIAPAHGVVNAVWDGKQINLFGARNEVIGFNLVIESEMGARGVTVAIDRLDGPDGASITTRPARKDEVFDYRGRNIELFHLRYLTIKGLSVMDYELNDERWTPSKMRRPFEVARWGQTWRASPAKGKESFDHRPGANKSFPEIAVPLEVEPSFAVPAGGNQSIWTDIYIPKTTAPGVYKGTILVGEEGGPERPIAVSLSVRSFTLPDTPSAIATASIDHYDIAERWFGIDQRFTDPGSRLWPRVALVIDRYMQMLRRHGVITMRDESGGVSPPRPEGIARIKGTMYSEAKGYDGPGKDTGDAFYFIAPYGSWKWNDKGQREFNAMSDAWMAWFAANAPATQKALYLTDEPNLTDAAQAAKINGWLDKLAANPGPGHSLPTILTAGLHQIREKVPRVSMAFNWYAVADTLPHQKLVDEHLKAATGNQVWQYNGKRPASGSFAIEDDGTAPRMLPWAAYKKGIAGWFNWSASYYYDYQNGAGRTDVWRQAKTFGNPPKPDVANGQTSGTYANGEGILQYPGVDVIFPDAGAPGLNGPVASLRLKLWRRGIQDHDYLALAMQKDPAATRALVERMVPKVLWEVGVLNPRDPSYQLGGQGDGIGWSINPDDWEGARRQLADIIEGKR
jgi:hypothetical protein